MGDLTHSTPTPSTYRSNQYRDQVQPDSSGSPSAPGIRPFLDGELWNDLSCTIYDLQDFGPYILAPLVSQFFVLPFEMPVDGKIQCPHNVTVAWDGSDIVFVTTGVNVVKRGGTSISTAGAGILELPATGGNSAMVVAGSGNSIEVRAGRWDLWVGVLNFSPIIDIHISQFYVSIRRGRKPTA